MSEINLKIEGLPGSGKNLLAQLLSNFLDAKGHITNITQRDPSVVMTITLDTDALLLQVKNIS